MYTPDELKAVQDGMDEMMGAGPVSPERVLALMEAKGRGLPGNMFLSLALDQPELHARVMSDARMRQFGPMTFLPQTAALVLDNATDPVLSQFQGTRGRVYRLAHPEGDYIIKPYQSTDERSIAPIVGELGIGPRQFPSIRSLMTEEFVAGTPTTQLQGPALAEEHMQVVGQKLGRFFRTLHGRNIFYNDLINDDMGKSHVICKPDGDVRLIDFGVALDVTDPSQFTDEQVWNYLRTLPEVGGFWNGLPDSAAQIVERNRDFVRSLTGPEILDRQLDMIVASLGYLQYRFETPEDINPLWAGFQESYGKA